MNKHSFLIAATFALIAPGSAAEVFAITDAKVHTMGSSGIMENATILIEDGEITAIGSGVKVPSGAVVINASGKIVTPGIFDTVSTLGVQEVGAVDSTNDYQAHDDSGPSFKVVEGFNPRSPGINSNRIEGVTRGFLMPRPSGAGHMLAGTGSVVHFGGVDDFVVNENAAIVAYLGERGAEMAGGARGHAMLKLREALNDAEDYRDDRDGYDSGSTREFSLSKSDLEALQDVIRGRIPLIVVVDRASDIEAVLKLGNEFALDLIIYGGAEAWMVADKIADADVTVVLNPLQNLPNAFESVNSTFENAARLHKAGVHIAFSHSDSHNPRNLTQLAGNAVANGLPWDVALRAITVNPGELFGGTSDCCTLEPGNTADLVVWPADPLEVTTFAEHVFVAGKQIKMKSRQTQLRDRYLDLKDGLPFSYRK
ncbi:MAG: amidohydrolase family protein [Gammaproteobacteria bacterium]